MAFQAVPQGVEIVFHALQNGVPIVSVWNINANVPVTPTIVQNIWNVFDAWNTSDWMPHLSDSYVLGDITATDISVVAGFQVVAPPTDGQGNVTGAQAAGNAALVASFRTGFSGRSMRGRTYVPALPATVLLTAQNVTAAYALAVGTMFTNLINALQTATYTLSVLSRYFAGALRVVGLLTDIVTIITDTKVDSQRRRTAN